MDRVQAVIRFSRRALPVVGVLAVTGLSRTLDLAGGWRGLWSTGQMLEELKAYDARRLGARFEVPFFLFQGETDVVTLTSLATEYFQEVEAPTKGLALIPHAGHFAAFTQPDRFLTELRTRVRPLLPAPEMTEWLEP